MLLTAQLVVDATSDDNDGGTVANPDGPDGKLSLREAIEVANLEGGADISFGIPNDSAQNPKTITLTSALPALGDGITISGPGANELTVSGRDLFQVFDVTASSTVSISGLTIAHGANSTVAGTDPAGDLLVFGGGIVNHGNLTLNDDTISNNAASTPTGSGGFVDVEGGAIFNDGTLTLNGDQFSSNSITDNSVDGTAAGGAVFTTGPLNVASSTFTGNTLSATAAGTFAQGGAIEADQTTLSATGSTFSGNSAAGVSAATGGAIFTKSVTSATITACNITGNSLNSTGTSALDQGAGVDASGNLSMVDSTISGNVASGAAASGGGLFLFGSQNTQTLVNCTIAGNACSGVTNANGGGIQNTPSGVLTAAGTEIVSLINCTVAGNSATATTVNCGGINQSGKSTLNLVNSIVAGNSGTPGDIELVNVTSADHNLIGVGDGSITNGTNGNQVGTTANPIDPKLGQLADNGGPTQTMALQTGSPAIDAGDNSAVTNPPFPGPPFTDQRGPGFPRIVNDAVDIGAFESAPATPGTIQFSAATFNANETDASATITLTRTGGSSGAISATVGVSGGTATNGTDYNFTSQVVNWADGDTATKTVSIPLIDDNATGESTQTVNLAISSPTGGAAVGTQSVATLDIAEDNDVVTPGTITWTGGSTTSSNWSDPANWDLNRAPIDGDSLVFPATAKQFANTDDIGGLSVNSITFQGAFTQATGGYTLSGADLTVGSGGIVDSGAIGSGVTTSVSNQIDFNVALAASQSWSINDSNNFHHLTVNGTVATGGFALTATGAGTIDIAGQIGGNGGLNVNGSSTNLLTLDLDHANTYQGSTVLGGGAELDVGADNAIPSTSDVTMQAGINSNVIKLAGHADAIGSLTGTQTGDGRNTFDLGTNGSLTTGGDSASTNFAGDITGSGTVAKEGAGTFDLTTANDYTGTTFVTAGTLIVDGSTATGNAVTVGRAATLGGVGTVAGTITLSLGGEGASGGTLSPGTGPDPAQDIGTLQNAAGVTFQASGPMQSGGVFAVQLGGTNVSRANDELVSGGPVLLGNASLDLTTLPSGGPFDAGQTFVIIQAGAPITTTFRNLPEGSTVNDGTQNFTIGYTNDRVTLTTQPLTQGNQTATYLNGQVGDSTAATFVHNLYRELLGREPDAAGQGFWVNAYGDLAASQTAAAAQQAVTVAFLNTGEYREHLLTGIYRDFLNRDPDTQGLQFWTSLMAGGADEKSVLAGIVGSDEYFAKAGGTPNGFVGSLYRDLLGRTGDPQGITFWEDFFTSPSPVLPPASSPVDFRTALAKGFLRMPEPEHKLLNGNFPGAAGGVGAPGTPALGAYGLAEITGDGWDNLYFQGNLSAASVDSLFGSLQADGPYHDTIAGMLDMTQYLTT